MKTAFITLALERGLGFAVASFECFTSPAQLQLWIAQARAMIKKHDFN